MARTQRLPAIWRHWSSQSQAVEPEDALADAPSRPSSPSPSAVDLAPRPKSTGKPAEVHSQTENHFNRITTEMAAFREFLKPIINIFNVCIYAATIYVTFFTVVIKSCYRLMLIERKGGNIIHPVTWSSGTRAAGATPFRSTSGTLAVETGARSGSAPPSALPNPPFAPT